MQRQREIHLLRREMDLLWGADLYGRPRRPEPCVAVAIAADGHEVRFGPTMPPELRRAVEGRLLVSDGEGVPPPELQRWLEELAKLSPVRLDGGPSYVFENVATPLSLLRIVTSDDGNAWNLSEQRPEAWGDAEEWGELLGGRLGPWAMGIADERIASICYTPVASSTSAEAGIWTHPEERGRGWATFVTEAWAQVAKGRFRTLFYSTGFYNAASQAVAGKLKVRRIGVVWQILDDARAVPV